MSEVSFTIDELNFDAVLCYVRGGMAYFTTQALESQWGDDWNDRPYEYNSGSPYEDYEDPPRWKIYEVRFEGRSLVEPCEAHPINSPYSVAMINSGATAWLQSGIWVKPGKVVVIPAGTKLGDFISLVESDGGKVYLPISLRRENSE